LSAENKKLSKKTFIGIIWNLLSSFLNQIVLFGLSIILARLLSPAEFGVVAMVTLITGFANILQDMGFNIAIIQMKEISEIHKQSVFWFNVFMGSLLTLIIYLCTPFVTAFYNVSMINLIMPFLAFNYLIGSLGLVQQSLLRRDLKFKKLSIIDILSQLISGIVAVILAYYGYGVWALVIQQLLMQTIKTILLFSFNKWLPKFNFDINALKEMLSYSAYNFGNRSLSYWIRKVDSLIIGKFLGATNLGIYNKAYRFLQMPTSKIKNQISFVVMSSFSKIQEDTNKIKKVSMLLTSISSLCLIPFILAFTICADEFVIGFLGEKWAEMIPILRLFSIAIIPITVLYPSPIYLSLGHTKLQFKVALFTRIGVILLIILGIPYGIIGVAIGVTIGFTIDSFIAQHFANKLVKLNMIQLIKPIFPILIISILSALFSYLIFAKIFIVGNLLILFLLKFSLASIVSILIIYFLKPKAYRDFSEIISRFRPSLSKYL